MTGPLRRLFALIVLALISSATVVSAQTATVIHNVNLRRDSSTDQAPIRLLKPPTKVQLLQNDPDDGYYNVRTAEGQEGWVWGKNVKIDLTETITVAATAAAVTDSIPDDWERPDANWQRDERSLRIARLRGRAMRRTQTSARTAPMLPPAFTM